MNKIIAYVSLGIVGALLLAVLICAFVPVNYNVSLQKNPDEIVIHHASTNAAYTSEDEEYKEILKLYNASGKQTVLDSLFLGLAGKGVDVDRISSKSISGLYSSTIYCVEFRYYEDMKLLKSNGKQFQYKSGNTTTDVTYKSIFMSLSSNNEMAQVTYYVGDGTAPRDGAYSLYAYTAYANQYKLQKYVSSLRIV